ncbi:MAG: GNAT family protein [Bacteroidota bacterium]
MIRLVVDEEITLALREEHHAAETAALVERNRAYLREWLPWVDHCYEEEDFLKNIRLNRSQHAQKAGLNLGIWYRNILSGMIGFHHFDHTHRKTSLGYWLTEDLQGNGIVTRATRFLVNYAFEELEMNRLEIRCAEHNRSSRAIPERLGFNEEGRLRQSQIVGGEYQTMVIYGMLKRDWSTLKTQER